MRYKFTEKYWTRFTIRQKDIHKATWFAFDNSIFYDSRFYNFTSDEFKAFIYMLCEASRQNKNGVFDLDNEHFSRNCRMSDREGLEVLDRCYKKLKKLQVLEQVRGRGKYAGRPLELERELELELELDNTILPKSPSGDIGRLFDFDAIYKKYPKKEGKARGMKICKVQIKSQKDFDDLSKAVDAYVNYVKKNATDPKYIKHFSTFMNSWKDWTDPETGTSTIEKKDPNVERWEKLKERLK